MRCLNSSEEVGAGTYRILSHVAEGLEYFLVLKRGSEVQLLRMPTSMLTIREGDNVLTVREEAGWRMASASSAQLGSGTMKYIDDWKPEATVSPHYDDDPRNPRN